MEVLVAVAVMGICVAALLGGLMSGALSSSITRQQADAASVLAGAGESVLDPSRNPWTTCAVTSSYQPTIGVSLPPGWTSAAVAVSSVQYWTGTAFGATCLDTGGSPNFYALQLVTVTVSSPGGRATLSRAFVKARQ